MIKFKATQNDWHNGFHITFKNGCTVSVQFGKGNYSDGGETTAEVAAWDQDGKWIKLSNTDDVRGWCSPDEVLEIMNQVANHGVKQPKQLSTFWMIYLAGFILMTLAMLVTLVVIA
jgi:hypothetical protein